jgi:hypothetical protein
MAVAHTELALQATGSAVADQAGYLAEQYGYAFRPD